MLQGGNPKQGGVLIFLVIYLMAIGLGMWAKLKFMGVLKFPKADRRKF
jgi:hypothetical protein